MSKKYNLIGLERALHSYFLRRRSLRRNYSVRGLGPAEAQTLVELAVKADLTAKRLAQMLEVDPSTASRTISTLLKKKLLSSTPNAVDRRESLLNITQPGRRSVRQIQKAQNEITGSCLEGFSTRERADFHGLLRRLADSLAAPQTPKLAGDDPITLETVRLGRVFGMAGDNYLRIPGLTFTKYSFLFLLTENKIDIPLGEISRILPFERSVVSKAAASLERERFIHQEKRGERIVVALTAKGRRFAKTVSDSASNWISTAVEDYSESSIQNLIGYMERAWGTGPLARVFTGVAKIKKVENEADRKLARRFAVERLVYEAQHGNIYDDFFSKAHSNRALFVDGVLRAVCELKRKDLNATPLFAIGYNLTSLQLQQFVNAAKNT